MRLDAALHLVGHYFVFLAGMALGPALFFAVHVGASLIDPASANDPGGTHVPVASIAATVGLFAGPFLTAVPYARVVTLRCLRCPGRMQVYGALSKSRTVYRCRRCGLELSRHERTFVDGSR